MFSLGSSHRYYLYRSPVDMRKGFDGLGGLVRNAMGKDPSSGEVYVFLNRSRNLLKLLHWEHGGFVVYYKRLEKGTFVPPVAGTDPSGIRWPELVMIGLLAADKRPDLFKSLVMIGPSPCYINDGEYYGDFQSGILMSWLKPWKVITSVGQVLSRL